MSASAILLHAWRLRRIRSAMAALRRRLEAYEAAYSRPPFGSEATGLESTKASGSHLGWTGGRGQTAFDGVELTALRRQQLAKSRDAGVECPSIREWIHGWDRMGRVRRHDPHQAGIMVNQG